MGHTLEEKRQRITARVSDSVRNTLEQAAELLGATVNHCEAPEIRREIPAPPIASSKTRHHCNA
jgi:hypothetical protein